MSVAGSESRYIDSRLLTGKIALAAQGKKVDDFRLPKGMTDNLLAHLQQAWGALTERSFQRTSQTGPIDVSLGLTAVHGAIIGLS